MRPKGDYVGTIELKGFKATGSSTLVAINTLNASINVDVFYDLTHANISVQPFIGIGLGYQQMMLGKSIRVEGKQGWRGTKRSHFALHLPINLGINFIVNRHSAEILSRFPTVPISYSGHWDDGSDANMRNKFFNFYLGYSYIF